MRKKTRLKTRPKNNYRATAANFLLIVAANIVSGVATAALQKTDIYGNGGARSRFPDNSMPAFEYAVELGVNALSLNLGVTKDNVLVVHDSVTVNTDLCLSPDPKLKDRASPLIRDLTLAEIRTYDCGLRVNGQFPNQKLKSNTFIPTFDELLVFLRQSSLPASKTVILSVEPRHEARSPELTTNYKSFIDLMFAALTKNSFPISRFMIQSFDFDALAYAKEIHPEVKTVALIDQKVPVKEVFSKSRADFLSPSDDIVTEQMIGETHDLGKKILPWSVNRDDRWAALIKQGVDGIVTDDPEALMKFENAR